MGERLPCKQEVTSSTLVFSTRFLWKPLCTLKTAYREKSIDDKKYLINQDIRGNVIKNINDDSIESFEENEVKKLAYCQHM